MAYLAPYNNYKFGQPAPKVATTAQIAELRKLVDFTQYVWPNVTKDWKDARSIDRDSDVNTCVFVWAYDTDYSKYGYQGAWTSLAEYITAAKAAGKIISGPQVPTAAQVAILRNCPDFQSVADNIVKANSYTEGGKVKYAVDRSDISKIMSIWSTTPAFKREYRTIEKYLSTKCASSGDPGGSDPKDPGSKGKLPDDISVDGIMAWLKADKMNPFIAALGGFAVYMILFKSRRR